MGSTEMEYRLRDGSRVLVRRIRPDDKDRVREAFAHLSPTSRHGEPELGVARYIRLENDPTVAEVAVTVLDSHQGRGLGTLLLALLARSAREHGIETFRAYVLEDNTAMIRIVSDLGGSAEPARHTDGARVQSGGEPLRVHRRLAVGGLRVCHTDLILRSRRPAEWCWSMCSRGEDARRLAHRAARSSVRRPGFVAHNATPPETGRRHLRGTCCACGMP